MELRNLRYFVAVAENLSFSRASETLHVAQSALSRQIGALERELGTPLFVRHRNRLSFTPAGETFLHEARAVLDRAERAVETARKAAGGELGSLEIGYLAVAMWSVLPDILSEYRRRHSGVRFHMHEADIATQIEGLLDGSLDVGFLRPWRMPSELVFTTIWTEPLIVVMRDDHPLAQAPEVDLAELAYETFIVMRRAASPSLHDAAMRLCHSYGFTPKVAEETDSASALYMIAAGLGVGLAPDSVRNVALPRIACRPLTAASIDVDLAVVHRREQTSAALDAFLKTVGEVSRDLGSGPTPRTRSQPD